MGSEARRNRSDCSERAFSVSSQVEPGAVTLRSRSPWGKMSEKLRVVAEPWISRLGDDLPRATVTGVYKMASTIWNTVRLPDPAGRSEALGEVRRLMAATLPDLPEAALQALVDEMYARAQQRYGDDPRLIAEVLVEKRGVGNYHVTAVSIDAT